MEGLKPVRFRMNHSPFCTCSLTMVTQIGPQDRLSLAPFKMRAVGFRINTSMHLEVFDQLFSVLYLPP